MKTAILIALVVFIIGGIVFLNIRGKRKKYDLCRGGIDNGAALIFRRWKPCRMKKERSAITR